MNADTQSRDTQPAKEYTVAVFGFSDTERTVLKSVFGLAARRVPVFRAHRPESDGPPDVYLVDADSTIALEMLAEVNASRQTPTLLIGTDSHGTGWPILARPLQWAKLFKAFDLAVTTPIAEIKPIAVPVLPAATTPEPASVPAEAAAEPPAAVVSVDPVRESEPESAPVATAVPEAAAPVAKEMARDARESAPVKDPIVQPAVAAEAKRDPQPADLQPPVGPRMREADWILVVDDSATVREFMKGKLTRLGFNVDYAASGEEAIGMTSQRHYRCIFLDVIMPGADGYQVCKMIKAARAIKKSSVVMLTSRGSPFDKIRGTMAGCDAYLTKPLDENKLLTLLEKFMPGAMATS